MKKIELKIDYTDFCNWYFDDKDNASELIQQVIKDGAVTIQCIADRSSFIPVWLVQNKEDMEETDIDDDEEVSNDKYRIILTRK